MAAFSKFLIALTLAFSLVSGMAEAKIATLSEIKGNSQAQSVIDAFNVIYPDLELAVAQPAADSVLINELEILKSSLHGVRTEPGTLIHLACCTAACGNDCKK